MIPERPGDVLVWRLPRPLLAISSAPLGGGLGLRSWVVNLTVHDYTRRDPDVHLAEVAAGLGLHGTGIGFLTGVDVATVVHRTDSGVAASVTTGIGGFPTWAAARGEPEAEYVAGTINVVAFLPVRLSDAALVNAVATVAEAKAQALREAGVPGTGTPTDATALLCPPTGPAERFGGPRSTVGIGLARAVHAAVRARLD